MFLELLCKFCYCFANVACFITHWHFYSLYSHRSVNQLVSLIALILFCCFRQIRAVNWVIPCQYTSNLLPYKHLSSLLPFLVAHGAAIRLKTCLQLLNRKKPTE